MSSRKEIKLEGDHKYWHRDGNGPLWKHEFYQDGELEGKRRIWHYDGELWILSSYRNGKLEGEFKWCAPLLSQYFRNDKLIDSSFSFRKKHLIIRIKRFLQSRVISPINMMLISDLARIVSPD